MSVQRIGGGSPSALAALGLALRQMQQQGAAAAGGGPVAGVPAALAPDAVMRDVVARAQFMASLRAASAAVEQVGTLLETFDGAAPAA